MPSSSALDTVCYRFLSCNVHKCPELRGKWFFFTLTVSNLQHEGQNRGFGKKGKIYFWCRAHHDFCVFWCRASFSRKTVFPTSTRFCRSHWKRSAKLARPQNAILAPEGPKWAILVGVPKRSRYICRCILLPFPFTFKKTRTIVWYFLLFPFLTTGPLLSFWWLNFSSAISTWVFIMVLVNFSVFLLAVFVFLGASASDSPWSLLFLSSIFCSSCRLSSFLGCMSSCSCVCVCLCVCLFFFSHLASFPSLVCPSLHDLCCSYLVSLYFLLLCMYLVWLFLLLWFLFLLLLFRVLCFFFSPGPRAHLKRKIMEETYFALFAFRGSLRICPFTESLFLLSLGWFLSSTEHVFVSCSWILFWWSDGFFVVS